MCAIGNHSPCIWCAQWHHGQLFVMYATLSLRLCKPGKTLIPTFMSFSPGSKAQQSKPKPPPVPPLMLLQYTNETAIYLSLILIPHKSFVQPANDTLCNILWQNNSQVRSSSHLVSGVFTEVRVLKTLEHGFTQPGKAENWCVDWLLSSGVQAADWAVEHWYCFVRMCMEKLQFSYSLFLHIELLHPTPKIYHKYYSWIKWSFAEKADEELVQIFWREQLHQVLPNSWHFSFAGCIWKDF
jgi:hypothetical protein